MTLILIAITSIVSIMAFNRRDLMAKMQFNPYQTYHRKEWHRLISHGFLHADYTHLIINMIVLFSFGSSVERTFNQLEAAGHMSQPRVYFVALYLGAILVSSLTTLKKHKDNYWYNAVGASGAVSAVVFTHIFFAPWSKLYLYFLIGIPGIVFGPLYLAYSYYMSKKNADMINHDAHFIGAVFGFLFPLLINPKFINIFLNQILNF